MPGHRRIPHVLAAAALIAVCAASVAAADGFKKAPPLKLPGLDGKQVEVSFHDSRLTLVNFWATWCMPCREEMPQINRLYQKYRERGFSAVGIALQSGEPADVRSFFKERKLDLAYPILLGTDDTSSAYGDVDVVPTTYLIGADGEVLKSYYGVSGEFEKKVGSDIENLLARGEAAAPSSPRRTDASAAAPPRAPR